MEELGVCTCQAVSSTGRVPPRRPPPPSVGPAAGRLSRGRQLITVSTSLWGSKYSEDQYGADGDIRLQYRCNRDIALASGRGFSSEEAGSGWTGSHFLFILKRNLCCVMLHNNDQTIHLIGRQSIACLFCTVYFLHCV